MDYTYKRNYISEDYEDKNDPYMTIVDKAIVLPAIPDNTLPWGKGGVLDSFENFVEESRLDDAFGAKYDYEKKELILRDESVICISIIPKHWGHILIDVLSKMWWITDSSIPHDIKIVFCGLDWDGKLEGVYKEVFDLMGIAPERMLHIQKPTLFRRVYLPSRTLGFKHKWNSSYLIPIQVIINGANKKVTSTMPISKVYFSREQFRDAQKKEIGENEISKVFEDNDYTVIFPEKLSLAEQIFIYNHCDDWVCISGSLAHNIVFSKKDVKVTILNRTYLSNPPQLRINQMMKRSIVQVDVFSKSEINKKNGYRAKDNRIVHILGVNNFLIKYLQDRGMLYSKDYNSFVARFGKRMKWMFLCGRQFLGEIKYRINVAMKQA